MHQNLTWLLREKYNNIWTKETDKDFARLLRSEPIDYIIGSIPFLGCKIDLSLRPLIPRPETEFWVEKAIEAIQKRIKTNLETNSLEYGIRVLDLFSGSGAIGIAVLKHIPKARVDFGEKDLRALEQIKKNIKLLRNYKIVPARLNNTSRSGGRKYEKNTTLVIRTDIWSTIKNRYDFVLANPPYIAGARKSRVHSSVTKYEPSIALWGGTDGLLLIKKFLASAQEHLALGGELWMEFDSFQKQAIAQLLKKYGFSDIVFHKDQYKKWRYLRAKK